MLSELAMDLETTSCSYVGPPCQRFQDPVQTLHAHFLVLRRSSANAHDQEAEVIPPLNVQELQEVARFLVLRRSSASAHEQEAEVMPPLNVYELQEVEREVELSSIISGCDQRQVAAAAGCPSVPEVLPC